MKKFMVMVAFWVALLMLLVPLTAFAAHDYAITDYEIGMIVNEDNTFSITENIEVNFSVPRRGIIMELPLSNDIARLDGTKASNRVKISDVEVSEQHTVYNENGKLVIRIGDPDRMLTGTHNYTISYTYNIGADTGRGYDELYFNLIGGWDTIIDNITFTITMPEAFEESKLGFSAGADLSTESRNISYAVNGNVITGSYNGTLNPHEKLTVRLELPDGYFVTASSNFDFMMWIALILPIVFLLSYLLIWLKYGKGGKIIETVEFYPPKGLNSTEIGFLYKGRAKNKDVISLLIYLANKGYVKITETEKRSLFFNQKEFKISKAKPYTDKNVNEKIFLNGLFEAGDDVTKKDLYNSFYETVIEIKDNLNCYENRNKLFEETSRGKIILRIVMISIAFLLITGRPALETGSITGTFIVPILAILVLVVIKKFGMPNCIVYTIGAYLVIAWLWTVIVMVSVAPIYLCTFIVGLACILGIGVLMIIPKRTPYGNEMLGKIRGFKSFLKTAEKAKLEELVNDDPEYFYNILPYTYVLGVSNKWIKKFEKIALQEPAWYNGTDKFTTAEFSSFMTNTMASVSSVMTSSRSSGSDGSGSGSSGGGFSGGGSGGSSGSSW